jgi:hypothetical protein
MTCHVTVAVIQCNVGQFEIAWWHRMHVLSCRCALLAAVLLGHETTSHAITWCLATLVSLSMVLQHIYVTCLGGALRHCLAHMLGICGQSLQPQPVTSDGQPGGTV